MQHSAFAGWERRGKENSPKTPTGVLNPMSIRFPETFSHRPKLHTLHSLLFQSFNINIYRRLGTIFQQGIKVRSQVSVLSCDTIRWFSPNSLNSCWLLNRWSLSLLWHLSDVSAICHFWPQLQILGGPDDPLTRPSRAHENQRTT